MTMVSEVASPPLGEEPCSIIEQASMLAALLREIAILPCALVDFAKFVATFCADALASTQKQHRL